MSTPDDVAEKVLARAPHAVRIGLECGQLANWLYHGLKAKGLPVILHRMWTTREPFRWQPASMTKQ